MKIALIITAIFFSPQVLGAVVQLEGGVSGHCKGHVATDSTDVKKENSGGSSQGYKGGVSGH